MTAPGPVLGCIADDFTGAVDVAAGTFAAGLDTVIVTADEPGPRAATADVVVIALKSRTAPVDDAVQDSLHAAVALRRLGVAQLFFKYCSTFDSTPAGNIGPVADALADFADAPIAVVAPSYPAMARTVRDGRLHVREQLLAETAMRHHPLTPMTSSDVPELLAAQSRHEVGLVALDDVRQGAVAVWDALQRLVESGQRYAVVDAVCDADIAVIADAVADEPLVTGGAALAIRLAARNGRLRDRFSPRAEVPAGRRVVLSGSCSAATQSQVAAFVGPTLQLDPGNLGTPEQAAVEAARWAESTAGDTPVLISTTVDPETLANIQHDLGREVAATRVEQFFGAVARELYDRGFARMVVAGGETSGAVTAGLGVRELGVTAPISEGLAWCVSRSPDVALALKSGNFGEDDVFARAHQILDGFGQSVGSVR